MTTADIAGFSFSAEEIEVFSDGDCWELARKVQALTGWAIVTASDSNDWYHAANRMPNGRIVDIFGVWSQSAWLSHWDTIQKKFITYDEAGVYARIWSTGDFNQEISDEGIEYAYEMAKESGQYAKKITEMVK
jgi:hypothetical protein